MNANVDTNKNTNPKPQELSPAANILSQVIGFIIGFVGMAVLFSAL